MLLVCLFSVAGFAATITSNATGGGNYNAGSTWAGGVAPTASDDVIIASGDIVSIPSGEAANSSTLTIQSGGTLQTTAVATINGTVSVSGVLTFGATSNNGAHTVTLTGNVTVNSGGVVNANTPVTGNTVRTFTNGGTLNLFFNKWDNLPIVNNGTIGKPSGGSYNLNAGLTNNGTLLVEVSTLRLLGSVTNDGSITVNDPVSGDATIVMNSETNNAVYDMDGGTFNGTGQLTLEGNTNLSSDFSIGTTDFRLNNGKAIDGTVAMTLTTSNGTTAVFDVSSSLSTDVTYVNNGTASSVNNNPAHTVSFGNVVNNGTYTMAVTINESGLNHTWTNNGILNLEANTYNGPNLVNTATGQILKTSTTSQTISSPVTNQTDGTITLSAGTVFSTGGLTNDGTLTVNDPASGATTLRLNAGSLDLDGGTLNGTGAVVFGGAVPTTDLTLDCARVEFAVSTITDSNPAVTLTTGSSTASLFVNGSGLSTDVTFVNNGTASTSGNNGFHTAALGTVVNNGTFTMSFPIVKSGINHTFTNNGTFELVSSGYDGHSFINADGGVINKSVNNVSGFSAPVTNQVGGTINTTDGTLDFNGT